MEIPAHTDHFEDEDTSQQMLAATRPLWMMFSIMCEKIFVINST